LGVSCVIWMFVHMAFAQAGIGDPHEFCVPLQLGDRAVAGIAIAASGRDQLMEDRTDRAAIGNRPRRLPDSFSWSRTSPWK